MSLKFILIDNVYYGNDTSAINRHHTKTYSIEGDSSVFCLSRCIDCNYFEIFERFSTEDLKYFRQSGCFPSAIKVDGRARWGENLSWPKAFKIFAARIEELFNE